MTKIIISGAFAIALLAAWPHAQQPTQPPPPQQPSEIATTISGEGGVAPRLAVPEFIALSPDAETVATAKTISQVLWDDLNFEREFSFIPRDVYSSIPKATSFTDVPFDRWRELNADGLIVGTVQKMPAGFRVEMKLFNVRTRQAVYPRQYDGSNPRLFAHTMSDEIHKSQRALNGVARTRLTFDSDRDGERMSGTVQNRSIKEIYISDYDGENQKRVTVGKTLNIAPRWSPDGRSIAYTSYRRGGANLFISNIFQGTLDEVTKGDKVGENWLPAWSPDGTKLAFSTTRDGNPEIYVVNRDGSGLRRITNNPSIDITPTWSPSGTQIAFTSDRSGTPQIYVVGADGLNLSKKTSESYCDRPTWSPAPFNEIAFASRSGPGFDIKVLDLSTGAVKALTFGEGTNESPAFAPNGRHLVFTSTRSGKAQVFTMARDGKNVRQITRTGNNEKPDWSK
ncbi:MAG: translocation protein TolB [Acidobacteria bacterium]|nr:translocation protein TolB [Acidobacteriota bacterium]